MSQSPVVSVIIPAFNCKRFLVETLQSVKMQTYPNYEVIIVDDGSTDGQLELIKEFCDGDSRFRFIRQENAGVSAARNFGFNVSVGSFIAFLDSDDVWLPNNLQVKLEKFNEGNFGLVHSDAQCIDENSRTIDRTLEGKEGVLLFEMLLWSGTQIPGPSSILVRRDILTDVGLFDTRLSTSADHDLFLRIASRCIIGRVPEITWMYRMHNGNMHRAIGAMEHDVLCLYKKAVQNGLLAEFWFTRKCYSRMYLILAASWGGDGRRMDKAFYFTVHAILSHPEAFLNLFQRMTKIRRKR
jgi:glycosyltransferase involved in cell wall biosynthesis